MDRFCMSLRSILLSVFAIVLSFLKQKALSAKNTFSLPRGIFWISNTVDCCSTCQTCAFSGKPWECVRTMNSSSASMHRIAWSEWEPRGVVGSSFFESLLMLEYLQVTEPVWSPATQPLPCSPASMWRESAYKEGVWVQSFYNLPKQSNSSFWFWKCYVLHTCKPFGRGWAWLGSPQSLFWISPPLKAWFQLLLFVL